MKRYSREDRILWSMERGTWSVAGRGCGMRSKMGNIQGKIAFCEAMTGRACVSQRKEVPDDWETRQAMLSIL